MMVICNEEIMGMSPKQEERLLSLKEIYKFWNQKINVISRKDMDQFNVHHVLHSLSIAMITDFSGNSSILDLGCGGGFPGIPLAIYFPGIHFHLVDSIGKKIKVVQEVARELHLDNVSSEQVRVEEIRGKKFDAVVSRAVAPLNTLWQWSSPLINKKNGLSAGLICLKGGDLANEIKSANGKATVFDIYQKIFQDDWFREKYIVQIKYARYG